jgi:methylase of polypeptide subunit release factors
VSCGDWEDEIVLSPDQCHLLADRLRELDYTVDAVVSAIGESAHRALGRNQTTPATRALDDRADRLSCLIRLWLLQQPVSVGRLDEALPELRLPLIRAGILAVEHDRVHALVDVRPYAADDRTYYICADLTPGLDGLVAPTRPDLVLGVSAASTSLAQLTPRTQAASAMDLGTGCGVQSLHLAQHADRVVATDVNPRAMELAEVTLLLNRTEDVELRQGDLFAPVAEDTFDLITTNPPYVMSPPSAGPRLTYREGNLTGDGLVERIVRHGPDRLRPGGTLSVLGNWAHLRGDDWQERLAGWLPAGCDAHVVQREVLDPCEYAEIWLADAGLAGTPGYRRRYAEWLDYFQALQIEAVGLGWIVVQRSETHDPSIRIEHWPYAIEQPIAPALVLEQGGVRLSRELSDGQLLAARWQVSRDVVAETVGQPGEADPEHLVLRQQRGMRRGAEVDTALGGVVGACDGELPLGVLIDSVAGLLDVDSTALRADLVPRIRRLVVEGFLLPSGSIQA